MSGKKTTALSDKDDAIVALLQKSHARPSDGFALRAAARFQAEVEAAQLRRTAGWCAIFFAVASFCTWIFLFNVQNATETIRYGIAAAVSLMRSIFIIWDNIPISCASTIVVMSCILLLCGGLLAKLRRGDVWVK